MKIAYFSADTQDAVNARALLSKKYGEVPMTDADVVVALGGDGLMLHALHENFRPGRPVFGMNLGSVGFLLNTYSPDKLDERLKKAVTVSLHPLRMIAHTVQGANHEAIAINEVSLMRETAQASKLKIVVDGKTRMEDLVCDGMIVSTPAGSTAYNLAAQGSIIPLSAKLLALTPISAFRPRRWTGALLPSTSKIVFEVIDPKKRPVSAAADFTEVRDVTRVEVWEDINSSIKLLFDPELNLDERIVKEQFMP